MRSSSAKLAAVLLVLFVAAALPGAMSGAQRRGAEILVSRVDGGRVAGELIAVKPGSLLLLTPEGRDASVDLAEIGSVRIFRRSLAGPFAGIGGAAGLLTGFVLGWQAFKGEEDQLGFAAIDGLFFGAIGAVSGLLVGGIHGIDSFFRVAGQPEEVLAGYWRQLGRLSRLGRLGQAPPLPPPGSKPAVAGSAGPASASAAAPRKGRRPRFRLSLGGSVNHPGFRDLDASGSFGFPGEAPPEAGPFDATFAQMRDPFEAKGQPRLTHAGLAFELGPRLAVETEVFGLGSDGVFTLGHLAFASTVDGRSYAGTAMGHVSARFSGLLLGLAVRPFGPSALRRGVLELGAAAGPALARGRMSFEPNTAPGASESVRKTILAARLRAAYDFYPVPSLSFGAFVDWRFAQADFAGPVRAGDVYFHDVEAAPETSFPRLTEVSFPPLRLSRSGFYWGLRLGFRI